MAKDKLTGEDAQRLFREVVGDCPDLERLDLVSVIQAVVDGTGGNLSALEGAITERGGIGPEIAAGFMGVGAMHAVVRGMPDGDDRRKLLAAGERVGEFMARRYRRNIQEKLDEAAGSRN